MKKTQKATIAELKAQLEGFKTAKEAVDATVSPKVKSSIESQKVTTDAKSLIKYNDLEIWDEDKKNCDKNYSNVKTLNDLEFRSNVLDLIKLLNSLAENRVIKIELDNNKKK